MNKYDNDLKILIVDDDPGHLEIILSHLEDEIDSQFISTYTDGNQLTNFLFQKQKNSNDLINNFIIILDVKMKNQDGLETLRIIKNNDHLKHIPVFMFSTTSNPHEIKECYKSGCNLFFTKSINIDIFTNVIKSMVSVIKCIEL